jgi:hypothetical protein
MIRQSENLNLRYSLSSAAVTGGYGCSGATSGADLKMKQN